MERDINEINQILVRRFLYNLSRAAKDLDLEKDPTPVTVEDVFLQEDKDER